MKLLYTVVICLKIVAIVLLTNLTTGHICYNLKIIHLNMWVLLSTNDKLFSILDELKEKKSAPDIIFLCETLGGHQRSFM